MKGIDVLGASTARLIVLPDTVVSGEAHPLPAARRNGE